MSINAKNQLDTNTCELTLAVDANAFEEAIQAAYLKAKKNIAIPGFRKGKAPRKMVEKLYGDSVFFEDAVNQLVPVELQKAVDDEKMELVDRPNIEVLTVSKEDGVTFKATCILKPEADIEGYRGIAVTKKTSAVTDEDVQKNIDGIRERNGRMITVERAAENGDTVTIDFKGMMDGVAFEGGTAENFNLALGSGQFIPGFEEQIVGHSAGEEFVVNVSFPEGYQAAELAGKPADFEIKLHEIKAKELPELDDEFVKDATEFDTVDQLKADVKEKLESQAARNADVDVENQLRQYIIDNVKVEVPPVMFEQRVAQLVQDFARQITRQGLNIDMYLRYTGSTMEKFKAECEERAHGEVLLRLGMEAIVRKENIEVSDEEINKQLEEIAKANNIDDIERIKAAVPMEDLVMDIKVTKAVDILRESAAVTEE